MAIRRITISVPAETARRMKKAAADQSVSAWVTGVIEERLGNAELDRLWDEFYRGVRPSAAETRRADALFKKLTRSTKRKSAA